MFKFENIEYFWLLAGIAIFIVLFLYFVLWRRKALTRFGESGFIAHLMPQKPVYKHTVKFVLLMLAFIFLVIGIANPQLGTTFEKVKRQGVDIMVALDVSKSMLAEDVKPSRLDRAKQFISRLIDKLQNDRIGLIVFAGKAYLQMPITIDYTAGKIFLKTIDTKMVPTQGTAIAEAIDLARNSFQTGETKHKALVIITDGENHEGELDRAIQDAVDEGVVVYTLGIGTPKGSPIPIYRNGVQVDFKRDKNNNIVLSRLNENMLQEIALKGNGEYQRLSTGSDELVNLMKHIASMEKKEFEERVFTDYEDHFQYFLFVALMLLVIESFLSDRKTTWFSDWRIFSEKKKVA